MRATRVEPTVTWSAGETKTGDGMAAAATDTVRMLCRGAEPSRPWTAMGACTTARPHVGQ